MLSILIVEYQRIVRESLEQHLTSDDHITVTASLANADLALAACRQCNPDLVLMDIYTEQGASGLKAAEEIKRELPHIKIVMITSMVECSFVSRARDVGADSFWYKDAGKDELLDVILRTAAGESIYPDITPVVTIGEAKSSEFTDAELDVLRHVVEGKSYKEIGEALSISPATVKFHIGNMLQKTGFDSKTKLAVAVTQKQLIINDL